MINNNSMKKIIKLLLLSILFSIFIYLCYLNFKRPSYQIDSTLRSEIQEDFNRAAGLKSELVNSVPEAAPQKTVESDSDILKRMGAMTPLKAYDLWNNYEMRASRILYEYLCKELEKEDQWAKAWTKEHPFNWEQVYAFEYDLNDDGINEIIGLSFNGFWGNRLKTMFVLEKQGNQYKNIADFDYGDGDTPEKTYPNLVILKEKTNGYHNMQFRDAIGEPNLFHLIKYNDGIYRYNYYKQRKL